MRRPIALRSDSATEVDVSRFRQSRPRGFGSKPLETELRDAVTEATDQDGAQGDHERGPRDGDGTAREGASREDRASATDFLERMIREDSGGVERVSLGWLLERMQERAFGFVLLVLALPCCIPFLYVVPQIVALPLLYVSAQVAIGRRDFWLPEGLRRREVSVAALDAVLRRAGPWLRRVETLLRPRLGLVTRAPLDRIIGAALLICSASILLPIPGTNTVPGVGVALIALGFLERDGLFVIGGSLVGLAWVGGLLLGATAVAAYLFG